jgi:peptide/nickel transport system ATP-binding protein
MYLGEIVEEGPVEDIFTRPRHPYTEALLAAAPRIEGESETPKIHLEGTVPSPANPPGGCRFHTRCPVATDVCKSRAPTTFLVDESKVSCHKYDEAEASAWE